METKNIMLHKNAWKLLDATRTRKDENKEVLKQIFIDPADGIVATNGCMLVKLAPEQFSGPEGLEAGSYEIIAEGKPDKAGYIILAVQKTEEQYPDYKRVIPAALNIKADQINITVPASIKKDPLAMTRAIIELFKHSGNAYSIEYIAALGLYTDSWTVDKAGTDRAARFQAPCGTIAIVLPFKIN